MILALAGILLGLAIGGACRWFDLPLPAPPRLVGALLVVAMTLGFLGADVLLSGRSASLEELASARPAPGPAAT